jgi:hypothetical protein
MRAPAPSITLPIGIEQSRHLRIAQLMMLDDGGEIEKWIVIASIFPIQKHERRRRDQICCDKIIMATAQVLRQSHAANDLSTFLDNDGIQSCFFDVSLSGHDRIEGAAR